MLLCSIPHNIGCVNYIIVYTVLLRLLLLLCSFVSSEQQLEPPVKKAKKVNKEESKSKDESKGKGNEKSKGKDKLKKGIKKKGIVL